jgi:general secretion pathway protein H
MTSPDEDASRAGFTLLEMLVVIGVLGLVLVALGGLGKPPGGADRLRFAAKEIAGNLRLARAQAVVGNRRAEMTFDLGNGAWRLGGEAWHAFPRGVRAKLLTTGGETLGGTVARIGFLPDGSSSGGRLTLSGEGRSVAVGVDWISGRVSIAETPY